jgi:two-component system, NtrC family, C4-dicarboxylate transport sensor histidine kinase DctB
MIRRRWQFTVLAGTVLGALALYEVHGLVYDRAAAQLREEARVSGQLRTLVLQSELEKQRSIPMILADDSAVIGAIETPDPKRFHAISLKLEKLAFQTKKPGAQTETAALYLLNERGVAVAASNWALPTSFVGSDYSFREYFRNALASGYAEQFALGTVSRKPGLYLARSIAGQGRRLGVVVLKVEFDELEATWAKTPDRTFVTGADGRILLTPRAEWRFDQPALPGRNEFLTSLSAPVQGWRLHVISSLQPAQKAGRSALATTLLVQILLTFLAVWWWRRRRRTEERILAESRYRQQLESNVASRTQELSHANERLSREMAERLEAEQKLSTLQADLVQANKLASLGQIIAGVAHEINQPLSTIRVLAENSIAVHNAPAPASSPELLSNNMANIVRMSERIGHITGELRAFSRKAMPETTPISLKETVDSSVLLNRSRLREDSVTVVRDEIEGSIKVLAGRIRLEQVIVNLLQNAFEALQENPEPIVHIAFRDEGSSVVLSIIDNGPGLAPAVFARLFTPFVTTKLKGLGLGLVISHDIVRDFGGELWSESSSEGARFHIRLRKVTNE